MEQIVSEIIGRVMNTLTSHITKHLRYITSSKKYVTVMRSKMEVLNGKSDDVREHTRRNNMYDKEIPSRVEGWVGDVEKLSNEVESIPSNVTGCLHMRKRYRAGKNASEAIEKIDKLTEEEITWTDAPLPTGRPTSVASLTPSTSPSGEDGFNSRDKPFNDALKFLQQDNDKRQVVALCGMAGVGKTTMTKQLKIVANEKKMFTLFVEVAVGRNPNILSVQNQIAESIGGEGLHVTGETTRGESLCKMFQKMLDEDKKRILVILDDVWQNINLEHIGLTSPLPNGVKLLLTSRDANICGEIAANSRSSLEVVRVDVLTEAEANNLFSRITDVSEENDHDKYLIGCEIASKCGCLPLAISIVASTLKFQDVHVWKRTLNRLKNKHLVDKVQESINISYEYIKDDEKEILLLCGLFPEDFDIPLEVLIRYAWGLNLLKYVSTLEDARDNTKTCVSNLINASLLIHSDHVGCIKMHDLVLAFVLNRVSKRDRAWIINHAGKWDQDGVSESSKIISLTCMGMSKFPRNFKYLDLSLLQLMHGDQLLKFPEDFYENLQNLKVMAYYKMEYPLLPRSLKCSTNLRTLCLRECKLKFDLSFLGDLVNLEELSFAGCGIRKLPSMIGNLRKLKLLDLTGCVNLQIDDGVFGNLENLEELYMIVADKEGIRFTDANFEEFKKLLVQLSALEVEFVENKAQLKSFAFGKLGKFKISIGCLLNEKEEEKYSFRNTLKIVTDNYKDLLDCKTDELFKKTEKLHLDVKDMIHLKDVVSVHPYDQRLFCYLRDLEVFNYGHLKYLFTHQVAAGLRKLERLIISSCSDLEVVVHSDGSGSISVSEIINFEELKFLSLEKLPRMVSLFTCDSIVVLPQLVELVLFELPNFTSIYTGSSNISSLHQPLLNSEVKIPKLEKLMMRSMEKLKQIWVCSNEETTNNISTLREIEVVKCGSLENLFPTNPVLLLSHLERLYVKECSSIEEIFNIDLGCVGVAEQPIRSSLRSIVVCDSRNVRVVWRIKGGENKSGNSPLLINGFEAVEELQIRGCQMFRNIFTRADIKFDMRALTRVTIVMERYWGTRPLLPLGEKQRLWLKQLQKKKEEEEIISSLRRENEISTIAFPYTLTHSFPYLEDLHLSDYNEVKVVFEIKSPSSNKELMTMTNIPLLPNLQHLKLYGMKSMSHVWECNNWNKFLGFQNQSSFRNLKTITMVECHTIRYLFSPLMAKLFSNLKEIDIRSCVDMEEVVLKRDDEDEDEGITSYTTTDFFPRLHMLSFKDLRNLKRIDGVRKDKVFKDNIVSWSLCQYSKEIFISGAGKLSSVIPSYAVGQTQKLEVLTVVFCSLLTEVFETTQGISSNNNGEGASLVGPKLGIINAPQLSNLMKLKIVSCNLLQHVFTISTLESLRQLHELTIDNCKTIKVIVKKENGEQRKVVEFPRLKSLELCSLPDLEGFFLGLNEFEWPSLEKVMISKCPQIRVITAGESRAKELKYIHTSLGKHTLECGLNFHVTTDLPHQKLLSSLCLEQLPWWSYHNLIEIDMGWNYQIRNIIPSNELLQIQKLERIHVTRCTRVEEVFEVVPMEGTNNEPQMVVEIQNLRHVKLVELTYLKYIWKINRHVVLEFPNLTTLYINGCRSLQHVFTNSMVGSLARLQELHISSCDKMEFIIEPDESKYKQMVVLPCLKVLKLRNLKSLLLFCLWVDFSWPLLDTLEIIDCPEISIFTIGDLDTPTLDVIHTSFGRCYVGEDGIKSFMITKHQEDFNSRR